MMEEYYRMAAEKKLRLQEACLIEMLGRWVSGVEPVQTGLRHRNNRAHRRRPHDTVRPGDIADARRPHLWRQNCRLDLVDVRPLQYRDFSSALGMQRRDSAAP